jgi:TRAP-type C4-dicarboxylate transport system permease small subunit
MQRLIKSVVENISALLYGLMIVVVFIQVVFRYVFNSPLTMSEEISRYIFIWLVMLGSVAATWDREHINLTFLIDRFPEKIRKFLLIFIDVCVAILIYIVLVQEGINITKVTMYQISPATGISIGWIYLSLPISGILTMMVLIYRIIKEILQYNVVNSISTKD